MQSMPYCDLHQVVAKARALEASEDRTLHQPAKLKPTFAQIERLNEERRAAREATRRHRDMCEDSGLVFMLPSILNPYSAE